MSGIGSVLGYEFRMSLAVPFVHVSFNTLISIDFLQLSLLFIKMCLPLQQEAWSRRVLSCKSLKTASFGLSKNPKKCIFGGVKSPCARPCGVQNLEAIAERTAMAPLGCEFCAPSVLPFVLFLFNKSFLITFF